MRWTSARTECVTDALNARELQLEWKVLLIRQLEWKVLLIRPLERSVLLIL